ncbi:ATP-binding protein [Hydrogenophaga pseudoflava]|uniref:Sensory/regulatory protein RpfC n=1 Tax=Hydrogenophaga pseudoflava TaxID=47421 RepID=A0A4P6X8K9_HYDPS|nr:ATP-binding protein [Hydrogenophaga pseudoflava]QBM30074.1 Aerobic respiration control sensor protein ArcB [Hydrogenophaga pseudoflava]
MTLALPNLARWQRRQWALAISLLLAITLTPLGWIQWRQYRMLDDVSTNQVDSIMWQAYQLERELGRLEHSIMDALQAPGTIDGNQLLERYEVYLSRIDLLTRIPRRDLLEASFEYTATMARVKDFNKIADPLFADPQALAASPRKLALLDRAIEDLKPLMGELTREANRAVARFVDERNAQLRHQGLLVIGLAAAQIAVMLIFVGLLVQHIRKQQRQYARLQKLSDELAEARDQAEAANHGKSIFLANMSHEIRTPFQGLLGMLNLLDDASLTNQQRDYLGTARDSAMHLLGVLNDILDVSTMESGTLKLSVVPIHLPSVVHEVDGLMQVAARDKGLELNIYAAADLPGWVEADATRLRQIMFNLINNAIKFTSEGSVIAELTRAPAGKTGVVLTVRDTGMGMDEETVSRLFTRFYQADNSLRRRIGGTGLGLEISRNLARMMGGDIEVSSQLGVGSVFTVHLDLPETKAPVEEEPISVIGSIQRKLRVLVAEDHPINLKYMSILLEKMGHEATFCENGQEALQLLAHDLFDVVLLDYHMPVLDGLATTEAIRRLDGPVSEIKVILVTADVVNDTRKRALEVGVNEFTSKPLQAEDLKRALRRCGLLDDPGMTVEELGPTELLASSPFPLSSYEMPVRLPDRSHAAVRLVDTDSYREIQDMMPQESLEELLKTLFESPEGTVHVLGQALRAGDRQAIGYNAHKLKGSAMLMGFRALVRTSAQIEHITTQTDDPVPAELGRQLLREANLTRQALRDFEPVQAA